MTDPTYPSLLERCKLQECKETCSYMYISGYPVDGLVEHQVNVTKACKEEYEFTQKYLRQRASYTTTCDKGQISFPRCIRSKFTFPQVMDTFLPVIVQKLDIELLST